MWINIMNLLLLLAISLGVMITIMTIRAYIQEKHSWSEIKTKASQSGINGFSE